MFKDSAHVKRSSQILKVLGNPYRLQILTLLLNGEKNVSEINGSIKISQPALSQHLSKLRQKGLLSVRREQRQMFYSLGHSQVAKILLVAADLACDMAPEKRVV